MDLRQTVRVRWTYKGTGGGTELRTAVVFRALTVANTQISVSSSSATISSGDTLNLNNGSSAISIAAADDGTTSVEPTSAPNSPAGESTDIVVTVDGNDYQFFGGVYDNRYSGRLF